MRKCVSCGSLLLGEVSVCGRCGTTPLTASIAAPDAASAGTPAPAPGPTQAPSYGRLSIPSPAGAPAGIGVAPASVPTPPAPPFQETWQPVTMPEAVAPPRATRLGLIALALAVVVVGALLVTDLRSDPLPAGTSAFVSGGGYTYTAPDNSFQVQLPQAPVTDQRTITVNSISGSRINDALDSALSQGINRANGTLIHKDLMMRGARPAIEGRFKAPDGYSAHLLVVSSVSTLVMLAVHAKSGTERLYKALESSLDMR